MRLQTPAVYLTLAFSLFTQLSCQTPKPPEGIFVASLSTEEYGALVEKYSKSHEQNSGLHNLFQFHATLVNTPVQMAISERNAQIYQWDATQLRSEQDKRQADLAKESKIFLSYYSPAREHDDLNKNNSIWKVYLESNGQKYQGKVVKTKLKEIQVRDLLPFHNRFSTAYEAIFPVSMHSIERGISYLIISSSLGTVRLEFSKAEGI